MDEKEMNEMTTFITNALSKDEVLAQLAEESAELAQAALKYRRLICAKNPTGTTLSSAVDNLIEETADVLNCLEVLGLAKLEDVSRIKYEKRKRWVKRLGGGVNFGEVE